MKTRENESQAEFEKRIALLDALMRLGSLFPKMRPGSPFPRRPLMGRVPPSRPTGPDSKRYRIVRGCLVVIPAAAAEAAA